MKVGTIKIATRNDAHAILRLPPTVGPMLVPGSDERTGLFVELRSTRPSKSRPVALPSRNEYAIGKTIPIFSNGLRNIAKKGELANSHEYTSPNGGADPFVKNSAARSSARKYWTYLRLMMKGNIPKTRRTGMKLINSKRGDE
jgi:hypothetical protein